MGVRRAAAAAGLGLLVFVLAAVLGPWIDRSTSSRAATIAPADGAAPAHLPPYRDFHIVMDTSGSMQIAADAQSMSALAALTLSSNLDENSPPFNEHASGGGMFMNGANQGSGCAFACHWDVSNNGNSHCQDCDFYELARAAGIPLRQDFEQSGVSDLLAALRDRHAAERLRVAVYGFDRTLTQYQALTTNLSAAANAARAVPPTLSDPWDQPNTNFGASATALGEGLSNCPNATPTFIPCPGSGAAPVTAQQFVVLITDGIEDFVAPACGKPIGRCQQPISPAECDGLKNAGVQLAVVYVQYVPLDREPYVNHFYKQYIQPFIDPGGVVPTSGPFAPVETNLRACASRPEFYAKASDSKDIGAALKTLLRAAERAAGK